MSELRDPEFDPPPVVEPGTCPRGRCDGSGFIRVSQAYVDSMAPLLTDADALAILGFEPNEQQRALLDEQRRLRRVSFANSSYPCPVCMPHQFDRWNTGHWGPNHDRANCPQCVADNPHLRPVRRRRRNPEGDHRDPGPTYTGDDYDRAPSPRRADIDG